MISAETDAQIRSAIADLFPSHDKDGNGRLAKAEFALFLTEAKDRLSLESALKPDEALTMFDRNWDGAVSKEEAYALLRYMAVREAEGRAKLEALEERLMGDAAESGGRVGGVLGLSTVHSVALSGSAVPSSVPSHIPSVIPSHIPSSAAQYGSAQHPPSIKLTSSVVVTALPPPTGAESSVQSPSPLSSTIAASVTRPIGS